MPKQLTINTEFIVYDSIEDLDNSDKELLERAKEATLSAYAPYSNFYVGAAVLLENGSIVTGTNQENAAYPSGLCAERVAVFSASSLYPNTKIKAIAVSARTKNKKLIMPLSPCGACRQSMCEYEVKFASPIKVIMAGEEGPVYISASLSNLLPLTFTAASL
ncbi:MAG: cytidine deaminase [Bacteroidia bacterium]